MITEIITWSSASCQKSVTDDNFAGRGNVVKLVSDISLPPETIIEMFSTYKFISTRFLHITFHSYFNFKLIQLPECFIIQGWPHNLKSYKNSTSFYVVYEKL